MAGSQYPIHGNELIIDVHLMNKIIELDEETFTLTVEPGVLVGDIHQFVESRGYLYPPDPASKHSSIGGNVATNAGGLRAVKYGVTRDYVRELTVVLPSGEDMTMGSLNIKSSSGYDLKDLYTRVSDLGGLPSAEHGIGTAKKEYFEKLTPDTNLKYMREIKRVFDPDNHLNPGKIFE